MATKPDELLPSAKDVMKKIALAEAEEASKEARLRAEAEAEKKALLDQLSKPSGLSDEEAKAKLRGLDVLFLDALRHRPHPTHSTVENSLRIVERTKPQRAFFTHICHDLGHEATNRALPPNVRLSYDGLKLEFEI